MAESIVQINEGTGKKLHTWNRTIGTNSVEDEYVHLGEPGVASYTVIGGGTTATANSHLLQIMAGATLRLRIRRIQLYQFLGATAAALQTFRLYRLTTAGTGGGVVTPSILDPSSDPASGATAQSLPTAKGVEGALLAEATGILWQTIGASFVPQSPIVDWQFDYLRSKALLVPSGTANGIAIKNINAIAAGGIVVMVWFDETSFL